LLSPKARVDTKPQLEITADNVKCSHGATISQLEEDELFYLRSRGLDPVMSRNLLIDGFAGEILQELPSGALQTKISRCVACKSS
jgi:Fe-S cluster assembly protein SufD